MVYTLNLCVKFHPLPLVIFLFHHLDLNIGVQLYVLTIFLRVHCGCYLINHSMSLLPFWFLNPGLTQNFVQWLTYSILILSFQCYLFIMRHYNSFDMYLLMLQVQSLQILKMDITSFVFTPLYASTFPFTLIMSIGSVQVSPLAGHYLLQFLLDYFALLSYSCGHQDFFVLPSGIYLLQHLMD